MMVGPPCSVTTCKEMYASALARLMSVTILNGTAGGNVPKVRIVSVGIADAVPAGAATFVLVGISNVAVIPVAVSTTVVGGSVGEMMASDSKVGSKVKVGSSVSVGSTKVSVGWTANVRAEAV